MADDDKMLNRYGAVALITGASSGIGAAFARALAVRGFDLFLIARREDRLQSLQQDLQKEHVSVDYLAVDLSDVRVVSEIVDAIAERDLGLIVSNAGFGLKGAFELDSLSEIDAMLNVNARTPVHLLHALVPKLRERGRGGIILTGSQEGEAPQPWSAAYAATKAFIHSLGQSLYGELRDSGIDVLVLAPGSTDTEAPVKQGFDIESLPGVMPAAEVAEQALVALGKGPYFMPGWMNRFMVRMMRLLPRRIAIVASGKGMAMMLRKNGHPVRG